MKIRMVTQMSGPRADGTPWPGYGAEFVVSDEEGRDLCAASIAVPVAEAAAEERQAERRPDPVDPKVETRGEQKPAEPAPTPPAPPAEKPAEAPPEKRGPGRPRKDSEPKG